MAEESELNHCCGDISPNIMDPITDYEKGNLQLKERLNTIQNQFNEVNKLLQETKSQLDQKRELLKSSNENLIKSSNSCTCDVNQLSNGIQMLQVSDTEPTLNDMTILDYEKTLSVYRDACAKAQAEKRMHLRRHLVANDFKKRLLEVESMCNMELLRIKQSVQLLQPLQAITSQWGFDNENSTCFDEELTGSFKYGINTELKEIMAKTTPSQSSSETS
ncbi:hypothetical protein CBL_04902 [Carabus blaptoides fortunei]